MTPRRLPVMEPVIGDAEIAETLDTLRSGWLTTGPKVERFERDFAARVGTPAALATSCCTGALHLSLQALGVGPGDEVVTTGYTYAATANAIVQVGAEPVFADVEPDTLNVDPACVEAAITPSTRAVIVVHFAGHPCELDALGELCTARGLALIEDAAQALSASYRGRPAGSFGATGCFSFYPNKNITTGEGGMLVGDRDIVSRARVMGRHGIDRDRRSGVGFPGLKWNMSDVAASIGIHQLARLDELQARRREIAALYDEAFAGDDALERPTVRPHVEPSWHLYVLRLHTERLRIDRDAFLAELAGRGIDCSVYAPLPAHACYRASRSVPALEGSAMEREGARMAAIPLGPALGDADVERVAGAVLDIVARNRR